MDLWGEKEKGSFRWDESEDQVHLFCCMSIVLKAFEELKSAGQTSITQNCIDLPCFLGISDAFRNETSTWCLLVWAQQFLWQSVWPFKCWMNRLSWHTPALVVRADEQCSSQRYFSYLKSLVPDISFPLTWDLKAEAIDTAFVLLACYKNLERNSTRDHWLPSLTVIREL